MKLRAGVILALSLLGGILSVLATPWGWKLVTASSVCYGLAWTYAWITRPRRPGWMREAEEAIDR